MIWSVHNHDLTKSLQELKKTFPSKSGIQFLSPWNQSLQGSKSFQILYKWLLEALGNQDFIHWCIPICLTVYHNTSWKNDLFMSLTLIYIDHLGYVLIRTGSYWNKSLSKWQHNVLGCISSYKILSGSCLKEIMHGGYILRNHKNYSNNISTPSQENSQGSLFWQSQAAALYMYFQAIWICYSCHFWLLCNYT